jgi:hypothetical protein
MIIFDMKQFTIRIIPLRNHFNGACGNTGFVIFTTLRPLLRLTETVPPTQATLNPYLIGNLPKGD